MKTIALALAIALFAGLGGCASSYHAYEPAGEGYSETRIDARRWRVAFVGAAYDSQATVERNLLRRAAELTLQDGYDWFVPVDASAAEELVIQAAPQHVEEPSAVWRPRWRRRSASRWTDWDPQGALQRPDPPAPPAPAPRYSAEAEIVMGQGARPLGAFDAQAIVAEDAR